MGRRGRQGQPSELSVELRCANCVRTFVDENALVMHCTQLGHFPVTANEGGGMGAMGSSKVEGGSPIIARPANRQEFVQYANVVLQRALGERLARW